MNFKSVLPMIPMKEIDDQIDELINITLGNKILKILNKE